VKLVKVEASCYFVDDAQAFFNVKAKKYYKSKRPHKPKKRACHFYGKKGHMRPKCKWKNMYRSMRFWRNYLSYLVAKRKGKKPLLHKQKKEGLYVMEAFDNKYLSKSSD
jgi:hypothetical protein